MGESFQIIVAHFAQPPSLGPPSPGVRRAEVRVAYPPCFTANKYQPFPTKKIYAPCETFTATI